MVGKNLECDSQLFRNQDRSLLSDGQSRTVGISRHVGGANRDLWGVSLIQCDRLHNAHLRPRVQMVPALTNEQLHRKKLQLYRFKTMLLT